MPGRRHGIRLYFVTVRARYGVGRPYNSKAINKIATPIEWNRRCESIAHHGWQRKLRANHREEGHVRHHRR
jgi:hypothetical protein